jgi:hypothetical protein
MSGFTFWGDYSKDVWERSKLWWSLRILHAQLMSSVWLRILDCLRCYDEINRLDKVSNTHLFLTALQGMQTWPRSWQTGFWWLQLTTFLLHVHRAFVPALRDGWVYLSFYKKVSPLDLDPTLMSSLLISVYVQFPSTVTLQIRVSTQMFFWGRANLVHPTRYIWKVEEMPLGDDGDQLEQIFVSW